MNMESVLVAEHRKAYLFFMNLPSDVQQLKIEIWRQRKIIETLMEPEKFKTNVELKVCALCAKKFNKVKGEKNVE